MNGRQAFYWLVLPAALVNGTAQVVLGNLVTAFGLVLAHGLLGGCLMAYSPAPKQEA